MAQGCWSVVAVSATSYSWTIRPRSSSTNEEQEDNTYKNLVLQYRDGTHISGELDVEEHIVYFKELTGYIKQQQQQHTNLNDTEWERECRLSVRSVVHTVTAILVEFESNHMGFEVFKVLSTKGYICDSKEMQVMLGRDFFVQPTIEQQQQDDPRAATGSSSTRSRRARAGSRAPSTRACRTA